MIKTKAAIVVFSILALLIFPYYIYFLQSDISSMIPGWNTNLIPDHIFSNLIKFLFLCVSVFLYWKLSKITNTLSFKRFLSHFTCTIPAIFFGKISLYELIPSTSIDPENFINIMQILIFINICLNILFFTGQIIFWRFYIKTKRII